MSHPALTSRQCRAMTMAGLTSTCGSDETESALNRPGPAPCFIGEHLCKCNAPRIERDGLAVRSPDPSDGRAVLVQGTPAGAKVVGSRRWERIGRLAALAGQLDPHHRQVLAASLLALLEMARFAAQPPNRPTAPLPPPTKEPRHDHPARLPLGAHPDPCVRRGPR